ncbi:MAG TPA: hypothetical protein VKV16_03795 [Solirubrobacteraceae bacterium]|nr:hypothetical protein [Solirubrobacteraceae bacterium]
MQVRHNPIRSETDAFRMAVATVALAIVAVIVGWLSAPLVGVGVFVVLMLVAAAVYMVVPEAGRRMPLREAAREPHRHGAARGRRHVLVIANEPLGGARLRERIVGDGTAEVEVEVLAPVLSSRAHVATSDIDDELAEARRRLERSLAWAQSQGLRVRGVVGDANPTMAIEDALRDFGADEVIVVTADAHDATPQEQEELRRLRSELDVPVVHVAKEGA